jgi:hypothetical protein
VSVLREIGAQESSLLSPLVTADRNAAKVQIQVARPHWSRLDIRPMKTITCHDCEKARSFSAAACLQCGSIEPRGPYRHSRREIRRNRIEERNDRTLIMFIVSLGAIYGAETAGASPYECWRTP